MQRKSKRLILMDLTNILKNALIFRQLELSTSLLRTKDFTYCHPPIAPDINTPLSSKRNNIFRAAS